MACGDTAWVVKLASRAGSRRSNVKGASFATIGPDHLMDPTRYVLMERAWDPTPPRPTAQPVPSFAQDRAPDLRRHRPRQQAPPLGHMS